LKLVRWMDIYAEYKYIFLRIKFNYYSLEIFFYNLINSVKDGPQLNHNDWIIPIILWVKKYSPTLSISLVILKDSATSYFQYIPNDYSVAIKFNSTRRMRGFDFTNLTTLSSFVANIVQHRGHQNWYLPEHNSFINKC
jgi:hypothetical protein